MTDTLTPDELDYFNERAAIMEFDANLTRYEAERRAMQETLKRRERK
jgi:hypothetical protein